MNPIKLIKARLLLMATSKYVRLVLMVLTIVLLILAAGAPGAGGGLGD